MCYNTGMENFPFNQPIAHRGLHGDVPENSLAAFRLACEQGFPIETDIHLTADGRIAVFHDDSLLRMTGDPREISTCTFEELSALRLNHTDERIPSFEELLAEVDGKVPLLIEIKPMKQSAKNIARALSDALQNYRGEYAVQSFHPFYPRAYKKLHPEVLCGVLASAKLSNKADPFKKRVEAYFCERLFFNFMVKPDFLSFCFSDFERSKRARKFKGKKLAWTVCSPEDEKIARTYADNIIFQNYIPN